MKDKLGGEDEGLVKARPFTMLNYLFSEIIFVYTR